MMVNLKSLVRRPKKRIGRGHGSGKVKTAGRGQKGQNARGKVNTIGFEGGQLSLIKRLPLLRGKMRNESAQPKACPVQLAALNSIPAGTTVSLATLLKYHMIEGGVTRVKILGDKGLTQKLTVAVPCSQSARKAIEKAGGTVEA
jgi:large subunit ribosomal protein L15